VTHGHGRDDGLRPVTACHAENVGSVRDGLLGEPGKIVAGFERDRSDSPAARLGGKIESGRSAVAGSGIDDEYAAARRADRTGPAAAFEQRPGVRA
jgi:hypothetical protein